MLEYASVFVIEWQYLVGRTCENIISIYGEKDECWIVLGLQPGDRLEVLPIGYFKWGLIWNHGSAPELSDMFMRSLSCCLSLISPVCGHIQTCSYVQIGKWDVRINHVDLAIIWGYLLDEICVSSSKSSLYIYSNLCMHFIVTRVIVWHVILDEIVRVLNHASCIGICAWLEECECNGKVYTRVPSICIEWLALVLAPPLLMHATVSQSGVFTWQGPSSSSSMLRCE